MSMPETAQFMDALAYLSMRDVLPIYYNVKVAQKGLRNEESIEMLDIISKSRGFDIGEGYGWTEKLSGEINTALVNNKNNNVASLVDTHRSSVEASIEKTMEWATNRYRQQYRCAFRGHRLDAAYESPEGFTARPQAAQAGRLPPSPPQHQCQPRSSRRNGSARPRAAQSARLTPSLPQHQCQPRSSRRNGSTSLERRKPDASRRHRREPFP